MLKNYALDFLLKVVSRGFAALSQLEGEQLSDSLGLSLNETNLLVDLWLKALYDCYLYFKPQSCNETDNFCLHY